MLVNFLARTKFYTQKHREGLTNSDFVYRDQRDELQPLHIFSCRSRQIIEE